MKKIINIFFLLSFLIFTFTEAYSQCNNTAAFGSGIAPTGGGSTTLTTCAFGGEYSTINSVVAGAGYRSTSSVSTDWITIREGIPSGPVIAFGPTPLSWVATVGGTYYQHVNSNQTCGSNSSCRTQTVISVPTFCTNSFSFGSGTAPTGSNIITLTTCAFTSEYSTINSVVAGNTYQSNGTPGTDYITIRQGSPSGPVIAAGPIPLNWYAPVSGTYYHHYSANSSCGTDGSCHSGTIQCISCAPPPPAPCLNTSQYPSGCLNAGTGSVVTISTCNFAGEYSCISGISAGGTYQFTATGGLSITVREGSSGGPVVGFGSTPLTVTATSNSNLYVHWNLAGCGTDFNCYTTTVQCLSNCAPPPTCPSGLGTGVFNVTLPYSVTGATTCGMVDDLTSSNTTICGSTAYTSAEDVVYTFTPSTTGNYDIVLTSNSSWVGLKLYNGCPLLNSTGAGSCVANISSSSGNQSILNQTLNAGVTYYLWIDQWASPFCIPSYGLTIGPAAPPWDPCANITPIPSCTTSVTATMSGQGAWTGIGPFGTPGQEQIFSYTPTSSGIHQINITGSSGGCWVDFFWKEASSGCIASGWNFIVDNCGIGLIGSLNFTAGTTYYILLDPESTGSFSRTFELTCPVPPPANDDCISATPVSCGQTITGNTFSATPESGLPTCAVNSYNGVSKGLWYVLPGNGQTVIASLCGSSYDTWINVYEGSSCGTLICVAGNDDACGLQSEVTFGTTTGMNYYILVSGFSSSSGAFTLNLTCCNPPTNDVCTSVTPVVISPGVPQTFTGNSLCSGPDGPLTLPTVWHAITTTTETNLTISYCGNTPSLATIYIVLSTICPPSMVYPDPTYIPATSFEFTSCGDGNGTILYNNLPAGTYYIPVAGAPTGPYTLSVLAECAFTASISSSQTGTCNLVDLTANGSVPGNYTYSWIGPGIVDPSLQNQQVQISNTSVFEVSVSDAFGCTATATTTIDFDNGPALNVTPVSQLFCDVATAQLDAGTITSVNTQLTTPLPGGNGQNGNMFDVTAISTITVTGFEISPQGGSNTVEIYYKVGTHVGSQTNSGAWTYIGSTTGVPAASPSPGGVVPVNIPISITIPAGATYAFYVTTTAGTLNYTNGTVVGNVWASDAYVQIAEGSGVAYPFGAGGVFTPRNFNGTLLYTYGNPNLSYNWTPGATLSDSTIKDPVATPTETTVYTVVVTDSQTGCTSSGSANIIVEETPIPVLSPSSDIYLCSGASQIVSTQYLAGDGYSFAWGGLALPTETFTVSLADYYSMYVTSPNGCISDPVYFTVNITDVQADFSIVTDALCHGDSTGSVEIVPLGAITEPGFNLYFGPFDYSMNGGPLQSSPLFTGLAAGIYNFQMHDPVSGCYAAITDTVGEPDPLLGSTTVISEAICFGSSDGSASASATGGTGPYTFDWLTPVPKSGESNNELPAGTWTVVVTDANGCSSTTTVTITEPDPVTVDLGPDRVVAYGSTNGGYTATGCTDIVPVISGGSGGNIVSYLWSNGATTPTLTGVCNPVNGLDGTYTYTVIVTDDAGCVGTGSVTLIWSNIDCSNNENGAKLKICHLPPGNPGNCQTICISVSAASVFIGNGSAYIGACNPGCAPARIMSPDPVAEQITVNVIPNPTNGKLLVDFISETQTATSIKVMDLQGRIVMNVILNGSTSFTKEVDLSNLDNGLYILNIMNNDGLISTSRVVKAE